MFFMKTYILIYEGFAQFEVVLASYFLGTKTDIVTVGIDEKTVASSEGFLTTPHITLSQIDIDEIKTFIIPGGDPEKLNSDKLLDLIKSLSSKNKVIGAICAGTLQLAKAGVLNGKKYTTVFNIEENTEFPRDSFNNENIVIDGNIITAKGNAYVDFALKIAEINDIFENEEDYQETVNYFKKFRDI